MSKIISAIEAACIVLSINFLLFYCLCVIVEPDSEPYPSKATFEEVVVGLSEKRTLDDYCTNGWIYSVENSDSFLVKDMPKSVLQQTFSKCNKFEMVFVSLLENRFNAKMKIIPIYPDFKDKKETTSVEFVKLFGNEYLLVNYTNYDIYYTNDYNLFGITRVVYKADDSIYSEIQKYEKPKEEYYETFPVVCDVIFYIGSWRGVLLHAVFLAEFVLLYKYLLKKRQNRDQSGGDSIIES